MKNIVLLVALLLTSYGFAQDKKVTTEKQGDLIKATYFYDNGSIEQVGTLNQDGKLHGEWVSYDLNGKKLALGNYDNGKKVGKWFFWQTDSLKEVDYSNNVIASVNEWSNKTSVAIRN
ncbi:MAG: toxin-antitoxin system YwqK family antitoxin [Aquaticitalea sp.]